MPRPQKHAAALRLYVLLELLYATGMRVSELVTLRRNAVMRDATYLTIVGKGGRERIVPVNDRARDAVKAYLGTLEAGPFLFPAAGEDGHLSRQVFARELKGLAGRAGISVGPAQPARAAARLREPSARGRRRPPDRADPARPRRYLNDADLHPCARRAAARAGRKPSSAGGQSVTGRTPIEPSPLCGHFMTRGSAGAGGGPPKILTLKGFDADLSRFRKAGR